MKRNIKVVSLAAAALLAVTPVISSIVNADAVNPISAQNTNSSNATTNSDSSAKTTDNSKNNQSSQTKNVKNSNSSNSSNSAKTNAKTTENSPIEVTFTQKGYTENGKVVTVNPNGLYFQISANSSFNPIDFTGSNDQEFKITAAKGEKITVNKNTVDSSKAGSLGTVQLSVADSTGKKTTITYYVYVKPEGMVQLHVGNPGYVENWMEDRYYDGTKFYVGKAVQYLNGRFYTSVSHISQEQADNANNNMSSWLDTKYVANSSATKATVSRKLIMHKAIGYTLKGEKTDKVYPAYTPVYVENEPINNNRGFGYYYQIYTADATPTGYYVKMTNITGMQRMLKHNAYIYSSSHRRTSFNGAWKLYKGHYVPTYGSPYKFKNGKSYYRIGGPAKQYVVVSNFK